MVALSVTFSDSSPSFKVTLQFDGKVRWRMLNVVLPSSEYWQVIYIL